MNKLYRLQSILFLVLLGLLPFNIRHIFNFEDISMLEGFREHASWSLFAFDLFLIVLIILIVCEIYNTFANSIKIDLTTYEIRSYSITRQYVLLLLKKPVTYFLVFLLISSYFSQHSTIAFYNSYRIILSAALFMTALFLFQKRFSILSSAVCVVFFSGIFQSIITLFQFSVQHSLNLKLLGESVIAPNILGVAKFEFASQKFIRAYGTFPHPNILGFFLLLSLACGIWIIIRYWHKKNYLSKVTLVLGSLFIIAGILLSYSRSIILSSFILLSIILTAHRKKIASTYRFYCSKLKINPMFQGVVALIAVFATLFIAFNLLVPRLCIRECAGDTSISLRMIYNEFACAIIANHPFAGIGPGNFVPYLKDKFPQNFDPWEFQPSHNMYLLITAETGLLGLVAFLIVIASTILRSRIKFNNIIKNPFTIIFFLILLISFVDHYFWTLPQGQMLFWLSLAFFTASSRIDKKVKMV
ncbi:MAG: O-antigen ligase family protein [Patescibacteria group bacterium]|nr:O-antigen ligase family protein [Patescibacteria group bacterium]